MNFFFTDTLVIPTGNQGHQKRSTHFFHFWGPKGGTICIKKIKKWAAGGSKSTFFQKTKIDPDLYYPNDTLFIPVKKI